MYPCARESFSSLFLEGADTSWPLNPEHCFLMATWFMHAKIYCSEIIGYDGLTLVGQNGPDAHPAAHLLPPPQQHRGRK